MHPLYCLQQKIQDTLIEQSTTQMHTCHIITLTTCSNTVKVASQSSEISIAGMLPDSKIHRRHIDGCLLHGNSFVHSIASIFTLTALQPQILKAFRNQQCYVAIM